MKLTSSRVYYRPTPPKMPVGLVELMEGLTREVLKNNPTDVYGFCAGHMQQLLEKRDGPIRKKTLTLEEKIAKAQEKVRQRAEKRRQRYDNELHHRQHGGYTPETNEDDISLSQKHSSGNILHTPINQGQRLVNSSEVEISQEFDRENGTPSEDHNNENVNEKAIKDDVFKNNVDTEIITDLEPKNENDILETSQTSDHTMAPGVSVSEQPNTEATIPTTDLLKNENPVESQNVDDLSASMTGGQKSHGDDNPHEESKDIEPETSGLQEFCEVNTNQHLSSPLNSMTLEQDGMPDTEKYIKNSAQEEIETIDDQTNLNKDSSIKLDEQSSLTPTITDTTNSAAESQSEKVHESNNMEKIQQSNDSQITQLHIDDGDEHIIKPSNGIEIFELSTNSGNNMIDSKEDTIESKTIDLSYRESPSIELQDPVIDTDMLESLSTAETDRDIATLITQDSTNYDIDNALKNDITLTSESIANAEIPHDDKESNMKYSNNEAGDNNEQFENQMNPLDTTEKPKKITKSIDENNDNVNSEKDTSIKQTENPQTTSQDANNMDLETAAITIQKVFRTFLFKSRASTFDDTGNDETIFLDEDDKNKEDCNFPIAGVLNTERRPHGITRMDTVLQTVNEEKSLSLSTDDSSLSSAATVIQAHVRGFLVRNKLNSNKTVSTNSLAASNSNEPSLTSLEMDNDQNKNKTVLNIHIVPEGGNYLSRDESLITSMDLSLDSSPPSSINLQLHPLGYDKSERRKQLKREDAIQSISPPSNNSGKLSEDVDSVKELTLNDHVDQQVEQNTSVCEEDSQESTSAENMNIVHVENINTAYEVTVDAKQYADNSETNINQKRKSLIKMSSDEMDVVTAFITKEDNNSSDSKLTHSGEFHDAMLPTKVSRSDTSVASGE